MHLIHPNEIELGYKEFEQRWCAKLQRLPLAVAVVLFCAVVGLLMWSCREFLLDGFVFHLSGPFRWVYNFVYGIPVLGGFAIVSLWLPGRAQVPAFLTCAILAWLASTNELHLGDVVVTSDWTLKVLVPLLILICLIYTRAVRAGYKGKFSLMIFSLIYWSVTVGGALYAGRKSGSPVIDYIFRYKPDFLFFTILIFAYDKRLLPNLTMMAVNPLNGIHGLLWPYDFSLEQKAEERRRLWSAAIYSVAFGTVLLILRIFLERVIVAEVGPLPNWGKAVYTGIGNAAGWNIILGLARAFGMRTRDATNFVLLSRTPAEYWSRGNTFSYLFVLNYVFLPVYRWTQARLFATLVAFFILFITSNGQNAFVGFFDDSIEPHRKGLIFLLSHVASFSSHFFWTFLSRRWWFFSRASLEQSAWKSWASILLTHVLYISGVGILGNMAAD